MANKKANTSPSQEELIRAAQEEAMKAVMEQAGAMFGSIPGFQLPGMEEMQAQLQAQMEAACPDLKEIQAKQTEMGTLGDCSPETLAQAAQTNMAEARRWMDALQSGTMDSSSAAAASVPFDPAGLFSADWEINRATDGKLDAEKLRLLAYGAPLFVYNSENVDSCDSQYDVETTREQMQEWWGITDRQSTLEIVNWLLTEGHHAEADEALKMLHEKGWQHIPETAREGKAEDVCLIAGILLEEGYCTEQELPRTVIAWDLVRVVNVGRWTYQCGYVSYDEMWRIMQLAVEESRRHFSSWEEYGRSFVLGRGVWHGAPDDCETAQEIVDLLLSDPSSPWLQIAWE